MNRITEIYIKFTSVFLGCIYHLRMKYGIIIMVSGCIVRWQTVAIEMQVAREKDLPKLCS